MAGAGRRYHLRFAHPPHLRALCRAPTMTDTHAAHEADPPTPEQDAASATIDTLEAALGALNDAGQEVPDWEFCEGFMTALLCTRRAVPEAEWLPVLLGGPAAEVFASPGEHTRFAMAWLQREAQLRAALEANVEMLDDPRALEPAVTDWRGLLQTLSETERADAVAEGGQPPALGQSWASGFLAAVDHWSDEWAPPRDKEIAESMGDALDAVAELVDDDRAAPSFNLYQEDAAPSVSEARFEALGEAIWAVYDLYAIAKSLGPRVAPAQSDKVGRNDPCPCGSGKKYKKCHGA